MAALVLNVVIEFYDFFLVFTKQGAGYPVQLHPINYGGRYGKPSLILGHRVCSGRQEAWVFRPRHGNHGGFFGGFLDWSEDRAGWV